MDKKKFLILLFSTIAAAFAGSFLASYFILTPRNPFDNSMLPSSRIMDRQMLQTIREQQKLSKDIDNETEANMRDLTSPLPVSINSSILGNGITGIKTEENEDAYKIRISLKSFNNDPKYVKVKVKGNKVTIAADYNAKDKHGTSSSKFYQSLILPSKIDDKGVMQEHKDGYLEVTIPKLKSKK